MIDEVSRIDQVEAAARPFINRINAEQRAKVFELLAATLGKNLLFRNEEEILPLADRLGIDKTRMETAYRAMSQVGTKENEPTKFGTETNFTSDPNLLGFYSNFCEAARSNSVEQDGLADMIIASKNSSLLFAAMKLPGTENYTDRFARALGALRNYHYLSKIYDTIPKRTKLSQALATIIAETCPASVISNAFTNDDIVAGSKDSIILARGLARTTDYASIHDSYLRCEDGSKESILLAEALAASGDTELVLETIAGNNGDEELGILAYGLQAAAIYTQIKTTLNQFQGR